MMTFSPISTSLWFELLYVDTPPGAYSSRSEPVVFAIVKLFGCHGNVAAACNDEENGVKNKATMIIVRLPTFRVSYQ
jgi:hypothetical protein